MRTAIIALYNSVPPTFGSAKVTYNLFKNMPGETYLIQLGDENKYSERNLINIPEVKGGRIKKSLEMKRIANKISRELSRINPDIIIFEGGSWAAYYWLLFSKLKKRFKKIIYHVHNVEYELRKQKENQAITWLTKVYEARLLKNCYKTFCVSENDAIRFKKIYGIKPLVLPSGVDFSKVKKISKKEISEIKLKYKLGAKNVLFMGMQGYKPNTEAISILKKKVMPILTKKIKDLKLILTGGAEHKDGFLLSVGMVPSPEIRKIISACDVCVAPIISGSGTRLKILEYLAEGKPVVSTSKGAEGLELVQGKELLIEDNLDEFWKKVYFLLSDRKHAKQIGENGRKAVKMKYDYKNITRKFYNYLKNPSKSTQKI